ncbi:hypothetical protein [Tessaracoccus palaemonis]|uniref:Uncharacterized protein n=1 Tax=Tessaracoccus palaemonis TaxID=2829499 RepID=A0ABX8SGH9_9ACTN|nr:hypothetical protein [Tessaracoccus palaemonis]QXT62466.1 hypothetical protein KDB89_12040 [Tessaracoccus palaemonis]
MTVAIGTDVFSGPVIVEIGEYEQGATAITLYAAEDGEQLMAGEFLDVITVNLANVGHLTQPGHVFVPQRYTQHANELERHGLLSPAKRSVTYGSFGQLAVERELLAR